MSKNPIENMYGGQSIPPLEKGKIALLCIDIQYHDAAPGFGFFANTSREDNQYYFDRLDEKVFPAVQKLQERFRSQGLEVIHARICSLTKDGRDRSLEHKRIGCHVAPDSKGAEFMPAVAPVGDEIIINKTGSGIFNTTNIDYILKNLGVTQLAVVGVLTNECIETAVRDGADKSYTMYMIEDGLAALTSELHEASLRTLHGVYGYKISSDAFVELLDQSRGDV